MSCPSEDIRRKIPRGSARFVAGGIGGNGTKGELHQQMNPGQQRYGNLSTMPFCSHQSIMTHPAEASPPPERIKTISIPRCSKACVLVDQMTDDGWLVGPPPFQRFLVAVCSRWKGRRGRCCRLRNGSGGSFTSARSMQCHVATT